MSISENAIIVICSRVGSSRLPAKAKMNIEGLSVIEHIIERLYDCPIPICLAVPVGEENEFIGLLEKYPEMRVFTGSPDSPLHRTVGVIESFSPEPKWVIRVTHDDMIIDQSTMLALLQKCENENSGYGLSPGIVEGAGIEVISSQNLKHAASIRKEATEFISYFVRGEGMPNPGITKI